MFFGSRKSWFVHGMPPLPSLGPHERGLCKRGAAPQLTEVAEQHAVGGGAPTLLLADELNDRAVGEDDVGFFL